MQHPEPERRALPPEAAELSDAERALDRLERLADSLDERLADAAPSQGGPGA